MKKYTWSVVFLAAILVFPLAAGAAELKGGEEYSLGAGQVLEGDLYAGAGNVSLSGEVKGDVLSAGGTVVLTGTVEGDVMVAGGTLTVTGDVKDDVRAAGGTVMIGGTVAGDVLVAGGDVRVLPDADIKGDLIVAGGTVSVEGQVHGKMRIWSGEARINAAVDGASEIRADKVTLGSVAVLNGGLAYRSFDEAQMDPEAKVTGDPQFTKIERKERRNDGLGILSVWFWSKLLMMFAAALVFGLVLKHMPKAVVHEGMRSYWKNALLGFAILVATPVAAIVLMATVVGFYLGIILLLSYLLMLFLSSIFGAILMGVAIYRVAKKEMPVLSLPVIAVGVLVHVILGFIPVAGWIIRGLFCLVALGSLGKLFTERVKHEEGSVIAGSA